MITVAIVGWGCTAIGAIVVWVLVLRSRGLREKLTLAGGERYHLEQSLRGAARNHAEQTTRLQRQVVSLQGDIEATRDALQQLYERVPGEAPASIDAALRRAAQILLDLRRSP